MAIAEEKFKVGGMSCNHCKVAVEKAVKGLPGVSGVSVELSEGLVRVEYDPGEIDRERIAAAIVRAGYRVAGC